MQATATGARLLAGALGEILVDQKKHHNAEDPYEWTNLADNPQYASTLNTFRAKLAARLPAPESAPARSAAEIWKDKCFKKYPKADTNRDGALSWPEYKAFKAKLDAVKPAKSRDSGRQ